MPATAELQPPIIPTDGLSEAFDGVVIPDAPPADLSVGLPKPTPNTYKTVRGFTASLLRKGTAEPGNGLYPRDGSAAVTDIEAVLSEFTIPGQELNVVTGSGMAAVAGAVLFGMKREGRQHASTRQRPVLLYSRDLYTQAFMFAEDMMFSGWNARPIDLSEPDAVDALTQQETPAVVLAETVANTANMPVVDVHGLLARTREMGDKAPLVVLDNTLPLSTGLNVGALLRPEDKVLVVESATKSAMHNSEHLGVVYSANEELIEGFRKYKSRLGIVTSTGAHPSILRTLEAAAPTFHERNRALFASAGKIAVALAEAQKELGDNPEFRVSFPTLSSHPHHAYSTERLHDGVSPLVWMECTSLAESAARNLLTRIVRHPAIQEQIREGQIFMGQSFGFKEGRLLYDLNAQQVRVAGGYGIDSAALAGALKEAAADV